MRSRRGPRYLDEARGGGGGHSMVGDSTGGRTLLRQFVGLLGNFLASGEAPEGSGPHRAARWRNALEGRHLSCEVRGDAPSSSDGQSAAFALATLSSATRPVCHRGCLAWAHAMAGEGMGVCSAIWRLWR